MPFGDFEISHSLICTKRNNGDPTFLAMPHCMVPFNRYSCVSGSHFSTKVVVLYSLYWAPGGQAWAKFRCDSLRFSHSILL